MKKTLAALVAVVFAAAAPVSAMEWNVLGPRALGMGGAGVAESQGPSASYWNPAALGRETENSYGFRIPVDVHAAFDGGVLQGAKDLSAIASDANNNNNNISQAQIDGALQDMNQPGTGVRINVGAGGDFKIGKLAVFANGFGDIGLTPQVDLAHDQEADFKSGASTPNTTKLILKAARIVEVGVGYGHETWVPGLFVGGNLKALNTEVGYYGYSPFDSATNSQSDISSALKSGNYATTSSNFGIDAGALWDIDRTFEGAIFQPRLGVTGRNLNDPKFTQPLAGTQAGLGKYSLAPQARAGLSFSPFNWWHFAADADLTKNATEVDGVYSRTVGVGTEIDVFNRSWINIPLRAGLSKNIAESNSATAITLGAGFNFLHLIVDISGMVTPKTVTEQSISSTGSSQTTKIPQELGASLSFSLLFGGSDSHHKKADVNQAPDNNLPAAQADQIHQNADKAQQELGK